jgi:hypothetical protein
VSYEHVLRNLKNKIITLNIFFILNCLSYVLKIHVSICEKNIEKVVNAIENFLLSPNW